MIRHRAGKTLIETLVIMVGLSVVIVTAGQLLHRLSQLERTVRNATSVSRAELRLTRDFRRDVRQSATATLMQSDAGEILRLDGPAGAIHYSAKGEFVLRTESGTTPPRQEQYRVGVVAVGWGLEGDHIAVLSIEPARQTARPTTSAGRLQIVAAIGGDRTRSSTEPPLKPPVEAPKPGREVTP